MKFTMNDLITFSEWKIFIFVVSNGMKGANDMKRTAGIHHITI
ncbi:hypothetical protein [Priestia abyssalis]|nr:hypothetical protein [Priestia abyssalis]